MLRPKPKDSVGKVVLYSIVLSTLCACSLQPTLKYSSKADQIRVVAEDSLLAKAKSQNQNAQELKAAQLTPAAIALDVVESNLLDLVEAAEVRQLVEQGVAQNPSLKQRRLEAAKGGLNWKNSRSELLPTVSAMLEKSQGEARDQSYNTTLNLSLPIDIWGQKVAEIDSSKALWAAQLAASQHEQNTVAAGIIGQYLQLQQNTLLVNIYRQREQLLEGNKASIIEQYRRGVGSLDDLETAKISSANATIALVSEQQSLFENRATLATMLGRTELGVEVSEQISDIKVLSRDNLGALLANRHDLKESYARILAAEANASVAYRALFPSFNLSANLVQNSRHFEDALLQSPVWTVLSQLSAPIFNGGKLRRQVESANMSAEQAYWGFQQALLAAVVEIESKLKQETSLDIQQREIDRALKAAMNDVENYTERYQQGTVSYLELTTVQDRLLNQRVEHTRIRIQRQTNRIELGLALGFGVNYEPK